MGTMRYPAPAGTAPHGGCRARAWRERPTMAMVQVSQNVQVGVRCMANPVGGPIFGKGARTALGRHAGLAWHGRWLQVSAPLVWSLRLNLSEHGSAQSLFRHGCARRRLQTSPSTARLTLPILCPVHLVLAAISAYFSVGAQSARMVSACHETPRPGLCWRDGGLNVKGYQHRGVGHKGMNRCPADSIGILGTTQSTRIRYPDATPATV